MKTTTALPGLFSVVLFSFTVSAAAQETNRQGTLSAPADVAVASEFKVSWDGPIGARDFISVDDADATSDRQHGSVYGYPSKKNPLPLRAPSEPGSYLIRYHLADGYAVVASTPLQVLDSVAVLEAPESAALGTEIKVTWTGPNNKGDFISIDPVGSGDRSYGKNYSYPKKGNPLTIRAPDEPGAYEVRYHLAKGYRVLGTTTIQITDVEATVDVVANAVAGTVVTVRWTGPADRQDFISIDPVGADERSYGKNYSYPRKGNPLKIDVPLVAGEYEVRYHLARTYRVIATAPFVVTDIAATLTAPAAVSAGGEISVAWSGPGYAGDFVSIDKPNAEEREYGNYGMVKKQAAPVSFFAPDDAGDYQLRYHLRKTYRVLGTAPLRVDPVEASLTAPDVTEAGAVFNVAWVGPGNRRDFIAVVETDTEEQKYGSNYAYTRRGNPTRLKAPKTPGNYELRYLTGQSKHTLARRLITVFPSAATGTLRVVSHTKSDNDSPTVIGAVELVLDASGSMLQRLDGERRIELARRALVNLTRDVLPDNTAFALRVFGHKEVDKCRTDLEIPLGPLNKLAAIAQIQSIQAMNLAKTPIGESLLRIADDLAGVEGPALIILVTDGEETCDGDPKAAIRNLQSEGFDVRVNIVGFAIDELALKEEFESWARLGNGRYFDAQSADDLSQAIRESLQTSYEVRHGESIVATGIVNGDPIELKPGTYSVRLRTTPLRDIGTVTIDAEKESALLSQ